MGHIQSKQDFDRAVALLKEAAAAYYDTGKLLMSDADYDALLDELAAAHEQHPTWPHDGLLDAVAGGSSLGGDVTHPSLMGSLEKVKTKDDAEKFVASVAGPVVVEPKLDGMAVRAVYENGRLSLLATRGDGRTGENITRNARLISGLPRSIPTGASGEIRGEVYMSDADFEYTNEARLESGKKGFANSRNAVAGTLRNTQHGHAVRMSFSAYDAEFPDAPRSYTGRMELARKWGVHVAADLLPERARLLQPVDALDALGEDRDQLGFPIDGAVLKADLDADRERLGYGTKAPKWAAAYKYQPNEAVTTLLDIEVGVGRTGRITLRAKLDPVSVGGTTITYATLHNPDFVVKQDLRIGQKVMVVRAGDVIPRVTAAMGEESDLPPWEAPAACPQCSSEWDTSSLLWRCTTVECSLAERLTHATSRNCLDIEGASEAICSALVETGAACDIADLLSLREETLASLPLGETATGKTRVLGATVAAKLMREIEKARTAPLHRVLASLGVRTLGSTLARRISAVYATLPEVRRASEQELSAIPGIGDEKARIIAEELRELGPLLDRLEAILQTPETQSSSGTPLAGMTVVVTGALTGPLADYNRNQVNELIESLGGTASGSVSKNTSLLVAAELTSSKAKKALELGIPVESPEQFAERIGR